MGPLSPDNEAFLSELVAQHEFPDRLAALDEAVRQFRRRKSLLDAIDAGVDQLDRGLTHQYEAGDLERFLADVEQREKQRYPTE